MFRACLQRRVLSTTATSPHRSIYISESTNPYFNLSLEDWLFRHKSPREPLLLFYQDEPCVVIGRNQNPWKEVNFSALRTRGIPFIRRRSGGGTVYHDLGNVNYSIHLPRADFDRRATGALVERAVRRLGIDARTNDRNDLCVDGRKVSGSAYKIVKDRAYHHGTMLISTELDALGGLLHTDKESMVTKGVASVRSPVCNLRDIVHNLPMKAFQDALSQVFRETYAVDELVQIVAEEDVRDEDYIIKGIAELKRWDWAYGQTPEFTYTISRNFPWGHVRAELRSKHGVLLSCTLSAEGGKLTAEDCKAMGDKLEGTRYGLLGVAEYGADDPRSEMWLWLQERMTN